MTEMVVLAVVFGNGMVAENVVGEVQDMPYAGFGGFVGVGVAGDVEFQVEPVDFECADLVLVCRIQTTKADSVSNIPQSERDAGDLLQRILLPSSAAPSPYQYNNTYTACPHCVPQKGILGYKHAQ